MASAKITVIGSLLVEHIFFIGRLPDIGESFPANDYLKGPGGKGANAAIATYRACHNNPRLLDLSQEPGEIDISVHMVGVVGNDGDGKYMMEPLLENKIDVSAVRTNDKMPTGMAFIMVQEIDDTRDNRLIYTVGANDSVSAADFATVEGLGGGALPDLIISQLELNLKAVEKMLETAGNAGIKVLLNAAPANTVLPELYRHVTHLVVNETEAAILSGYDLERVNKSTWKDISDSFLYDGVENVVITLGVAGAYYANKDVSGHVKAFTVDLVDPTGAGDTFVGAYAAEYVRQQKIENAWDIEKAVVRACAAGGLAVTEAGGQAGIPFANQIEDLMKKAAIAEVPAEVQATTGSEEM